jgi:hypothetical protein
MGDVFSFKINMTSGHHIFGVAHDGIEQGGFTGPVGAHDHMGFAFVDDQIQAFQISLPSTAIFNPSTRNNSLIVTSPTHRPLNCPCI